MGEGTDSLTGLENATGSAFRDTIRANSGLGGDDNLYGGLAADGGDGGDNCSGATYTINCP